jgi:hypothetical protein
MIARTYLSSLWGIRLASRMYGTGRYALLPVV